MSFLSSFWERKYGKGTYNINFVGVACLKKDFSHPDEIEEYGKAVIAAKALMKKRWFITQKNILVCGDIPGLSTCNVSIEVEGNILFLLSEYGNEIQEGYAIPTIINIEGVNISKEEDETLRSGFWAIFSVPPK